MNQSAFASEDVDQLKALRARWRENNAGFVEFANLVWTAYTLKSPIGRLLDTASIRFDRANMRLTDAIYDVGGRDNIDAQTMPGVPSPEPRSPIAAAIEVHWHQIRDGRSSRRARVPLQPDAMAVVIAYARERVALLVEVDKALNGRVAKGLRAWRRLLELLEAEIAA